MLEKFNTKETDKVGLDQPDNTLDTADKQLNKDNADFEKELNKSGKTEWKDSQTDALLKKMVETSKTNLSATLAPEDKKTFDEGADKLTKEFDAEKSAILQSDAKPEEKREALIKIYHQLTAWLESLQGSIEGPKGAQKAQESATAETEAQRSKEQLQRFHKEMADARQKLALEKMNEQRNVRLAMVKEHIQKDPPNGEALGGLSVA